MGGAASSHEVEPLSLPSFLPGLCLGVSQPHSPLFYCFPGVEWAGFFMYPELFL